MNGFAFFGLRMRVRFMRQRIKIFFMTFEIGRKCSFMDAFKNNREIKWLLFLLVLLIMPENVSVLFLSTFSVTILKLNCTVLGPILSTLSSSHFACVTTDFFSHIHTTTLLDWPFEKIKIKTI